MSNLGIVGNIKTIEDYANARQATQNALQTSQLDNLSKQNVYATQLLSGAAATGDQNAYDTAKQHLANNGIDVSSWAPDVQSGAQQANAARLAQSPLGSLIGAGLKQESNDLQRAALDGQLPPRGLNVGGVPIIPNIQAIQQRAPQAQSKPWVNPDVPQAQPMQPSASTQQPNVYPAEAAAAQLNNLPQASAPTTEGFSPPAQMQGETLPSYRARVEQAFQQYKESPQAVRQKEVATNQGKNEVANIEASNKAQELTDRLTKNLTAMLNLNDSVPQSGFVPAQAKAYLSRALQANPALSNVGLDTSGNAATAYDQWNQINNQQVLSEIQQFVASGGANARVNQTLEKIAQAASSIHPEDSPASRKAQIQNALAELQNKNISSQNLVKANQGQAPAGYTDLPVTVPSKAEQVVNNTGINTIPPQKGEVRGGYLFMGGNPNDKNSYKKVQ